MNQMLISRGAALIGLSAFLFLSSCQKKMEPLTPALSSGTQSNGLVLTKLAVTAVSSPAMGANAVTNLTDGNLYTAWTGNNQAIYLPNPNSMFVTFRLDTTVMQSVGYIKMAFANNGNASIRYNFDVLVSQDGLTGWVTVLSAQNSSAGNNGLQTFDFPDTKGKWVRIVGHGNNGSAPNANSWTEVEIFGSPAAPTTSVKLSIPAANVAANAYTPPYVPANIVDGNLHTNWSSHMSGTTDYKNVTADLGSIHTVDQIKLSMYTGGDPNRVSRFGVFVSTDNTNWTKVISNTWSASTEFGERLENFDFPDVSARYVRVECYGHTGTYSSTAYNSINELEVWGSAGTVIPGCRITQINQHDDYNGSMTRTGTFIYTPAGDLDSVRFNKDFGGREPMFFDFSYDGSHHLTHLSEKPTSSDGGPFPGYPKHELNFTYTGNVITAAADERDDVGNTSTTYSTFVYDGAGRIVKEYRRNVVTEPSPSEFRDTLNYTYNAGGNRTYPAGAGVSYDNKRNFLSTNPVLQFITRDYSVNNPFTATGYNASNLPLGFTQRFPINFLGGFYQTGIQYDCSL